MRNRSALTFQEKEDDDAIDAASDLAARKQKVFSEWVEKTDTSTGKPYWYNVATSEMTKQSKCLCVVATSFLHRFLQFVLLLYELTLAVLFLPGPQIHSKALTKNGRDSLR